MKKILLALLTSAFVVAFVLPVFAGPEESLQVQVTPTLVSVVISPASIDFGTLALDQESQHPSSISVTNNGSVVADMDIKGSDAAYDVNTWALSDVDNGSDRFMLKTSKDGFANITNLSSTYKDYTDSLTVGTNRDFRLRILMPTSTSAYGEYTANIYVLATQT